MPLLAGKSNDYLRLLRHPQGKQQPKLCYSRFSTLCFMMQVLQENFTQALRVDAPVTFKIRSVFYLPSPQAMTSGLFVTDPRGEVVHPERRKLRAGFDDDLALQGQGHKDNQHRQETGGSSNRQRGRVRSIRKCFDRGMIIWGGTVSC